MRKVSRLCSPASQAKSSWTGETRVDPGDYLVDDPGARPAFTGSVGCAGRLRLSGATHMDRSLLRAFQELVRYMTGGQVLLEKINTFGSNDEVTRFAGLDIFSVLQVPHRE